jgi:3-deoxy-manno-octulosonate cytidylyltransferase (CMP-KDO synthetase)
LSRPPTPLESLERLEQLRLLEHGMIIAVRSVQAAVRGIDTETDLARVRARLMGKSK